VNGRTIANLGSYLIWANKDNVWASTGGRPTPIANDIKELLINSNPANWCAETVGTEYNLYLGNTEANGISYTHCLATFSSELGYWRWRELYDDVTVMARYTSNNEDFLYLGVADGMVHVKSKYTDATPIYTDDTKPILAHFRTKAFDFGDPSILKTITKIVSYCKDAQQLSLRFRIITANNEIVMPFTDIGKLTKTINTYDKSLTGNFIQLEGKEYGGNKPFSFFGISLLLLIDSKL